MIRFNAEKFFESRVAAGYTQKSLAEALQDKYGYVVVDYSTICRWEKNRKACPRKKKLQMVCQLLGIDIESLYEEVVLDETCLDGEVDILNLITRIIDINKENPSDTRLIRIRDILNERK